MKRRATAKTSVPPRKAARLARPARPVEPAYFDGPEAFRTWLERNGATAGELLIGFHKRATGRPSMTWPESVDEALCFGWIDGVRARVDDERYTIRFTPRRPSSAWSAVNVGRVRELERLGRMRPAGRAAFEARPDDRTAGYSYEQRHHATLSRARQRRLRADAEAWAWFSAQAPSYQRGVAHWIGSAVQEATRERRFESLLASSRRGELAPPFRWAKGAGRDVEQKKREPNSASLGTPKSRRSVGR